MKEASRLSTEEQIGLAFGLFAAGLLIAWLGWMVFRHFNPRKPKEDAWLRNSTYERMAGDTNHRKGGTDWTKSSPMANAEEGQAPVHRTAAEGAPPPSQQGVELTDAACIERACYESTSVSPNATDMCCGIRRT